MTIRTKYPILLLLFILCIAGCTTEDDIVQYKFNQVTLNLPVDNVLEITSRAVVDEIKVNDILAVIIRNNKTECEVVEAFTASVGNVQLTLAKLNPQSGEKLYIFCNTGVTAINGTNENDLLTKVLYTNSTDNGLNMYGAAEISDVSNISISLNRSFSKATLTADGMTVNSWKVCNVPSQGYVAGIQGYPLGTVFTTTIAPDDNGTAYFIPRTDNSVATSAYTCLLVEISGKGWFRLDFYNGGNLGVTQKFVPINLASNTHYKFSIQSISEKGYDTEAEALANTGTNIYYDMTVTEEHALSNGQYVLLSDVDYIHLYPVASTATQTLEVLHLSALIPENSVNDVTTYKVRLVNPSRQLKIVGGDSTTSLNLYQNVPLTTTNSNRTITLSFNGADVLGSYIEVQLGNIIKQIPIDVISSNCYLFDFSSAKTLYIPYAQANNDGKIRINRDMEITSHILWTDQDNISLDIKPDKDKQWLEVTNVGRLFTGNVIITAEEGGVIRWSWHIWALGASVLEFDNVKGVFDFKSSYVLPFNQMEWMDRNLGAYDLTPNTASSRGLLYQWGRKDPFPGSADIKEEEPWLYVENGGKYRMMNENHPIWGTNVGQITPTQTGLENCLEYSINHPNCFLKGHDMYLPNGYPENDWYTDDIANRNNYLWISSDRKKTAYNPCPIGWTLPIGGLVSPWVTMWPTRNATLTADGVTWNKEGYFPFGAYRAADGTLNGWSAVVYSWGDNDDTGWCYTCIDDEKIEYTFMMQRSMALNLRCVREHMIEK